MPTASTFEKDHRQTLGQRFTANRKAEHRITLNIRKFQSVTNKTNKFSRTPKNAKRIASVTVELRMNQGGIAQYATFGRFRIIDAQGPVKFLYRNRQDVARQDLLRP